MPRGPKSLKPIKKASEQHSHSHRYPRAAIAKLTEEVLRQPGTEFLLIVKSSHKEKDGSLPPLYIASHSKNAVQLINESVLRASQKSTPQNPVFSYGKNLEKEYYTDLKDPANIPAVGQFTTAPSRRLISASDTDTTKEVATPSADNTTTSTVNAAQQHLAAPGFTGNLLLDASEIPIVLPPGSVRSNSSDGLFLYEAPPPSSFSETTTDALSLQLATRKRALDPDFVFPQDDHIDLHELKKQIEEEKQSKKKKKTDDSFVAAVKKEEYVSVKGKKKIIPLESDPIFSIEQFVELGNFEKAAMNMNVALATNALPSRQALKKYQKGRVVKNVINNTVVDQTTGNAFNLSGQQTNEVRVAVFQIDPTTYQQVTLTQQIDVQTIQHVDGNNPDMIHNGATQYFYASLQQAPQTLSVQEQMDLMIQSGQMESTEYQSGTSPDNYAMLPEARIQEVQEKPDNDIIISTFTLD